jgi:6-phosphogluconate dehydrogenase
MRIGMVGLGRMGGNMTKRLIEHGHEVVAYDRNPETVKAAETEGALAAHSLEEVVEQLSPPRAVWVMVPAGKPTEDTCNDLAVMLDSGDVLIDGGNSFYKHAQQMASRLAGQGISFLDAGTSGGVWGLKNGYCLMVGGDEAGVAKVEPVFRDLAPQDGYAHVGPAGAGHFVKMVHNGIEYGMLQAYAEGFAIMHSAEELDLDLHQIAGIWQYGSVVRSWLLELAVLALKDQQGFESIRGYVEDSGEGRWTVEEAIHRSVSAPVITASLFERFSSRTPNSFAARIVAALRNEFGGHRVLQESAAAEVAKDAAEASGETPSAEGAGTESSESQAASR